MYSCQQPIFKSRRTLISYVKNHPGELLGRLVPEFGSFSKLITTFQESCIVSVAEEDPDFLTESIKYEPDSLSLIMDFSKNGLIRITRTVPGFWTLVATLRPRLLFKIFEKEGLLIGIMDTNIESNMGFLDFAFKD